MASKDNSESSRDAEAGLAATDAAAKKAVNETRHAIREIRNIPKHVRRAKKVLKTGGKILKKAGEAIIEALKALLSNPIGWLILIILLVVLICILVLPNSAANEGNALIDEDAWSEALTKAQTITEEAITDSWEKTQEEAQERLDQYLEDTYGIEENTQYISMIIVSDDAGTIASDICPYILAMNGTLQYYLDIDNLDTGFTVRKETEYNTLGSDFSKAIREYAEQDLFSISDPVSDVEKKPMEVPVLDENGVQLKDAEGHPLTEEKEVFQGTVWITVNWDISGYKADDYEKALDVCAEEHPAMDRSEVEESMDDYLSAMLYSLAGTFEYGTHGGMPGTYLNAEDIGFDGSIGFLEPFGENANGTSLWAVIRQDAAAGYFRLPYPADIQQCTNFAAWACWKYYGFGTADHAGRNGNGKEVAENLAKYFPDRFALSSSPAPGAIFSTWDTASSSPQAQASAHTYGHVGIIVKVQGEYLWECDGNIRLDGLSRQIAVNRKWKISDFEANYKGAVIYAVPVK